MGERLGAGLAQAGGLSLAAGLGQRLGVCGEVDGEPQPDGDLKLEAGASAYFASRGLAQAEQVRGEDDRHQGGRHLDHEHNRVAHQLAWVELAEGRQ